MTTHILLPSCMKERVISLMNDLEEEDFYRENFDEHIDDGVELKDIPTANLEPSHYKTLRQMIDFTDSYKELKKGAPVFWNAEQLQKEVLRQMTDFTDSYKELQEENEKLGKENLLLYEASAKYSQKMATNYKEWYNKLKSNSTN